MTELEMVIDKVLDTFFHLPTLILFTVVSLVLLWGIFDMGFEFGAGFIRLNTNQGNINLLWMNGCCEVRF